MVKREFSSSNLIVTQSLSVLTLHSQIRTTVNTNRYFPPLSLHKLTVRECFRNVHRSHAVMSWQNSNRGKVFQKREWFLQRFHTLMIVRINIECFMHVQYA